ncbi:MAG: hypothetical protein M3R61_00215 [Chloroflexota bacterium]|nr:hypothetical protein [Chloroflexota bacterium]
MALAVQIIGDGTTWHLNNSSGAPTSGGAATAAATSPFQVIDDSWTIQAAQPEMLYSGGPPLRDGSSPVLRSWPNVTESFALVCVGGTADTTASLMRTLTQVLNTALYAAPCVLGIQPNGATSMMYTEVYRAVVQPTSSYLVNPVRGSSTITLQITITRSPFFGRLSSGETLLNAATLTNTGTGGSTNVATFSAGAGDLIYAGGPVNYSITPDVLTPFISTIYLASVHSRTYKTPTAGSTVSTTNTTVGVFFPNTPTNVDVSSAISRGGLKARVMAILTAPTSNLQVQITVSRGNSTTGFLPPLLYTSPWVTPGSASPNLIDLGGFPLDLIRRMSGAGEYFLVKMAGRSTNGLTASATWTSAEILLYRDFCRVDFTALASSNITLTTFPERSSVPCLPFPTAFVISNAPTGGVGTLRGTVPRYWSGASLYAAWAGATLNQHDAADTVAITATHAPLYTVARGAG